MNWPSSTTAHEGAPFANLAPPGFQVRPYDPEWGTYQETVLTCTYCGSIQPQALYELCRTHPIQLSDADWKYGWPHKFYVEGIPNPVAGQEVTVGRRTWTDDAGVRREEPIKGAAPATIHAKFYTEHMRDLLPPEYHEAFRALAGEIRTRSRGEVDLQLHQADDGSWTFHWRGVPQGIAGLHY